MAKEIRLQQMGQTMEEGTVVSCKVKVGDFVKKGDVIFDIETDKATIEMESPLEGYVKSIPVKEGQIIPVGELVMMLGDKEEQAAAAVSSPKPQESAKSEPVIAEKPAVQASVQPQVSLGDDRVKASPRAKKLAEELGVDLTKIIGTGPGGRISEEDVQNAGASKKAAPAKPAVDADTEHKLGQTFPLSKIQKLIGQRMLQSKLEIPCFYLNIRADVTSLFEYRSKRNASGDIKISFNDFIIKAAALALADFPMMTGQIKDDTIVLAQNISVGLAIAAPIGLVAPVVKDANKLNITEIAKYTQNLIEKAKNSKLSPSDMSDGSMTISNLGAFGIDSFIPIVVPGQCSILGIGQIVDTCVPDNGSVAIVKMMSLTLSVDHKVANGAYAARFLDCIRKNLENPAVFE